MSIQKSYGDTASPGGNLVGNTSTISGFPTPGQRKLFNFGERVAELNPEESPFFAYLSKVAKTPTDDSVFRVLENRSGIDWTNRTGKVAEAQGLTQNADGTTQGTTGDLDIGDTLYLKADNLVGISELIPGMILMFNRLVSEQPKPVYCRVENAATGNAATDYTLKVVENSGDGDTGVDDNTDFQIVGTAFGEGSGAPQFFSSDIDDTYGYTQIFKTSCYMSGTTLATVNRGYASEWNRVWNMKLREHKVDIERALLFGQKARDNDVQYTDGIIGNIFRNVGTGGNLDLDGGGIADWSYVSGKPFVREIDYDSMTYDRFLGDMEVVFDPARGGSTGKLALAGMPTITFFNKVGATGFLQQSIGSAAANNVTLNVDLEPRNGAFGHKILKIDTIHGELNLIKDPILRGQAAGYMPMIDLGNVAYRPLVGNGINRDTHIMSNVQTPDEDSRKDVIMTEAGLEVTLPESHALYVFN